MSATATCRDMSKLHPYVQAVAETWLELCRAEGLDPKVSETWRSDERQAYLFKTGASAVKTKGAHGYGIALDFYFAINGKTAYPKDKMTRAGEIAESLGFAWGGRWKTLVDMPHIEFLGGVTLAKFRAGKRPTYWALGKDDEAMTLETFGKMFDMTAAARAAQKAKEPPSGGRLGAEFAAAKAAGITDGSAPQSTSTREQAAVMTYRAMEAAKAANAWR